MEETIVKALIEFYKERNIDLSALVGSPLFATLPVEAKVRMIKKYAGIVSSQISPGISRNEIKDSLIESGLAAMTAGAAAGVGVGHALSYYTGGKIPFSTIAKLTAMGAGIGFAGSTLNGAINISNRRALRDQYINVAKDPTDVNAIKLLATQSSLHPSFTRMSLLDKIQDFITDASGKFIENKVPAISTYDTMALNSSLNVPFSEKHDPKDVLAAFNAARDAKNK